MRAASTSRGGRVWAGRPGGGSGGGAEGLRAGRRVWGRGEGSEGGAEGLRAGRRAWGGAEVLGEGRKVLEAGRRVWGRSRGLRRRGRDPEGWPRAGKAGQGPVAPPLLWGGLGAEEPDQPLTRWGCDRWSPPTDTVRELRGAAPWEGGGLWASLGSLTGFGVASAGHPAAACSGPVDRREERKGPACPRTGLSLGCA